jgi:hypothetical protein
VYDVPCGCVSSGAADTTSAAVDFSVCFRILVKNQTKSRAADQAAAMTREDEAVGAMIQELKQKPMRLR